MTSLHKPYLVGSTHLTLMPLPILLIPFRVSGFLGSGFGGFGSSFGGGGGAVSTGSMISGVMDSSS